jgi:hypothetical protein
MDSLTARELANDLEQYLGISVRSTLALEYPTVNALVGELEIQLSTSDDQPSTPSSLTHQPEESSEDTLEQLPEEQLDAFLQEMIQDES